MIDFKNAEYLKLAPIDARKAARSVDDILVRGEEVAAAFRSVRDTVIFTNKRAIAINVQGVTGSKADMTSLPYSKVQAVSVETPGVVDLDCELQLWFSTLGLVRFEFTRSADLHLIGRLIGEAVL